MFVGFKSEMGEGYVCSFTQRINQSNGGEDVQLVVDLYSSGDGYYTNAAVETVCYGESYSKIGIVSAGFEGLLNACEQIKEAIEHTKNEIAQRKEELSNG